MAVGSSVGTSVGVGVAVGASVGTGVAVGSSVGTSVETSVGSSVGTSVGSSVGSSVGISVGSSVGSSVAGTTVASIVPVTPSHVPAVGVPEAAGIRPAAPVCGVPWSTVTVAQVSAVNRIASRSSVSSIVPVIWTSAVTSSPASSSTVPVKVTRSSSSLTSASHDVPIVSPQAALSSVKSSISPSVTVQLIEPSVSVVPIVTVPSIVKSSPGPRFSGEMVDSKLIASLLSCAVAVTLISVNASSHPTTARRSSGNGDLDPGIRAGETTVTIDRPW